MGSASCPCRTKPLRQPAEQRNDRSRDFGVVVCDLGLPDIAGNAMIRAIIGAARRPVKVVVISGESQQSLTRALEAGAAVAFAKPCEWADVVGYLQDPRGSTAA